MILLLFGFRQATQGVLDVGGTCFVLLSRLLLPIYCLLFAALVLPFTCLIKSFKTGSMAIVYHSLDLTDQYIRKFEDYLIFL